MLLVFGCLASLLTMVGASSAPAADIVYGQGGSFTTMTTFSPPTASTLTNSRWLTTDFAGNLYVSDGSNNRVLEFLKGSTTASHVWGQPNFVSASPGTSSTTMDTPRHVALDTALGLFVCETGNNRILYFPPGSLVATKVYGQEGNFNSNTDNLNGPSSTSLSFPVSLAYDTTGIIYVCDNQSHRVLGFVGGSTNASIVIGQPDFVSNQQNRGNGGASADSFFFPTGIVVDPNNNLYVSDQFNNRILFFVKGSTTASRIYGQLGSFTSGSPNAGPSGLNSPAGVTIEPPGSLLCADAGNNRVLRFPLGSTIASFVYGQPNFNSANFGTTQTTLFNPFGVTSDVAGNVYISDTNNNRVLQFGNASITILTSISVPTVIIDSAVVAPGSVVRVSNTLSISGNLNVQGLLILDSTAAITVGGSVTAINALQVSTGATLVAGGTLNIIGASFTPVVTINPGNAANITIVVAQFSQFGGGSFTVNPAVVSFANPSCVSLGPPSQDVSSTALSTTIAVTSHCSSNGGGGSNTTLPSSTPLSAGAIAGITLGCVIVAALAVCGLYVFHRYRVGTRTTKMSSRLKERELDEVSKPKVASETQMGVEV